MPFARARTNITHRLCTTTASSYQPLFRSRTFAHSPNSKPWYVDHEENESSKQPEIAAKSQRKVPILPAPKDSPAYLARAYSFLSASPLIDNSTLSIGRPPSADTHPESDLPLPLLKSVRKARSNRNILGYGDGVGEGPGQGVYNWQLVAQVLEGTEARGAIEVVSRSLRDTLKREFPQLTIPSKRVQRERGDGWTMLDIEDSIIHICSRRAWQKWLDPTRGW